jgi:predicted small metal-binding protein
MLPPGSSLTRMRVIDCQCGTTLKAANDEDLASVVRDHVNEEHPDMDLSDEQVQEMVAEQAYDAEDA